MLLLSLVLAFLSHDVILPRFYHKQLFPFCIFYGVNTISLESSLSVWNIITNNNKNLEKFLCFFFSLVIIHSWTITPFHSCLHFCLMMSRITCFSSFLFLLLILRYASAFIRACFFVSWWVGLFAFILSNCFDFVHFVVFLHKV